MNINTELEAVTLKQTKLWTKDFIIMSSTSFFISLVYFLLMTTLAVYAIQQFSASESMAGLAASIFVIGAVFSRPFTGRYIETIGRKKVLFAGLLLFLAATLLYFTITNMYLLLLSSLHPWGCIRSINNGFSNHCDGYYPYGTSGRRN